MHAPNFDPRSVVVFGHRFHDVTFEEAVSWAVSRMKSGPPSYMATVNLDFVMQARRDPEMQRILLEADLVTADGDPLVRTSGLFGPRLRQRVTGSDLVPMLAGACACEGLKIFLLGGAEGVAERTAAVLKIRNPGLKICGTYAPPVTGLLEMNHGEILRRLRLAKPDLLLVAFGAPKQEKFINLHFRSWGIPLAVGVGGTFDFIAGVQKRAPRLMQNMGMEWLWRLSSDPRRLFGRYVRNLLFLVGTLKRLRRMYWHAPRLCTLQESTLDFGLYESGLLGRGRVIGFSIADRDWLSSADLGRIVGLAALLRRRGGRLVLHGATPRLRQLLVEARLAGYLELRSSEAEARFRVGELRSGRMLGALCFDGERLVLRMPVECSVSGLSRWTRTVSRGMARGPKSVFLDAVGSEYVDTAGVMWLLRFRKECLRKGIHFTSSRFKGGARRALVLAGAAHLFGPQAESSVIN
jgi:N-acetylglucosaminyldiphosphoundecaprenol N-acetyl-beta-D-mannosaminyltransferase